eukprot:GHVN01015387.1.p1 GENE.GHVN01015387.1~~GHVN01015387.1.p1  ORF type:complete len:1023 (-),score=218.36 GHVN01015387.1:226-3294(-)
MITTASIHSHHRLMEEEEMINDRSSRGVGVSRVPFRKRRQQPQQPHSSDVCRVGVDSTRCYGCESLSELIYRRRWGLPVSPYGSGGHLSLQRLLEREWRRHKMTLSQTRKFKLKCPPPNRTIGSIKSMSLDTTTGKYLLIGTCDAKVLLYNVDAHPHLMLNNHSGPTPHFALGQVLPSSEVLKICKPQIRWLTPQYTIHMAHALVPRPDASDSLNSVSWRSGLLSSFTDNPFDCPYRPAVRFSRRHGPGRFMAGWRRITRLGSIMSRGGSTHVLGGVGGSIGWAGGMGVVGATNGGVSETSQDRALDRTDEEIALTTPTPSSVRCMAWYPFDNGLFVTGGGDGIVKVWSTWDSQEMGQVSTMSSEGKAVLGFDMRSPVSAMHISSQRQASTKNCDGSGDALSGSSHGGVIAVGLDNGALRFIDLRTGTSQSEISNAHNGSVSSVEWCPPPCRPHELVSSGLTDGCLRVWDVRRLKIPVLVCDEHARDRDFTTQSAGSRYVLKKRLPPSSSTSSRSVKSKASMAETARQSNAVPTPVRTRLEEDISMGGPLPMRSGDTCILSSHSGDTAHTSSAIATTAKPPPQSKPIAPQQPQSLHTLSPSSPLSSRSSSSSSSSSSSDSSSSDSSTNSSRSLQTPHSSTPGPLATPPHCRRRRGSVVPMLNERHSTCSRRTPAKALPPRPNSSSAANPTSTQECNNGETKSKSGFINRRTTLISPQSHDTSSNQPTNRFKAKIISPFASVGEMQTYFSQLDEDPRPRSTPRKPRPPPPKQSNSRNPPSQPRSTSPSPQMPPSASLSPHFASSHSPSPSPSAKRRGGRPQSSVMKAARRATSQGVRGGRDAKRGSCMGKGQQSGGVPATTETASGSTVQRTGIYSGVDESRKSEIDEETFMLAMAHSASKAKAHVSGVSCVRFTLCGRYLVSIGNDNRIRLFNSHTGRNTFVSYHTSTPISQMYGGVDETGAVIGVKRGVSAISLSESEVFASIGPDLFAFDIFNGSQLWDIRGVHTDGTVRLWVTQGNCDD